MHNHTTHQGKSRTYRSWAMMKTRCLDTNYPSYPSYGGRGITVCTEWMDFSTFLEDMGDRPDNMTLDRIDNNLGYYKENCRWATKREQALNRNIQSNNTTGITGVSKTLYGYRAYTTLDGKQINMGTYTTMEEATKAREEALDLCVYLKTLLEKQANVPVGTWIPVKDFEEKTIKEATQQWTSNNTNNGLYQPQSIPVQATTDLMKHYTLPLVLSVSPGKLQEKSRKSYGEIMSIPMM